jgi:anti-sigma regulatory factor (Ser/Thr protein kinase)
MSLAGELRIGTSEPDLALVFPWLDEAIGVENVPERLLYSMHVVLEEAVMNVALHGYPPGQGGEMAIRLKISPGEAVLEVEDAGLAFDPVSATVPNRAISLADAKPGGLGLGLMRQYCPDLHYQRIGGRNLLTMRFPID